MSNPYHDTGDGRFISKEKFATADKEDTVKISNKKRERKINTSPDFQTDLAKVIQDLHIISESDYPLEVINQENFRVVSLDVFINNQIQATSKSSDKSKFESLKILLKENLSDPLVLIVGNEPLKTALIIGKDEHGFYQGLISFVVET